MVINIHSELEQGVIRVKRSLSHAAFSSWQVAFMLLHWLSRYFRLAEMWEQEVSSQDIESEYESWQDHLLI